MNSENESSSPISPSSSIKQKLKKAASLRLPWVRHPHLQQRLDLSVSDTPHPSPTAANNSHNNKPRLSRSSTWRRAPELKDKCRSLINRIGSHNGQAAGHGSGHHHSHGHGHGRRHSADFRYDASSYALNFDEGCDDSQLDEFPRRNFSARLPRSPPTATRAAREITA